MNKACALLLIVCTGMLSAMAGQPVSMAKNDENSEGYWKNQFRLNTGHLPVLMDKWEKKVFSITMTNVERTFKEIYDILLQEGLELSANQLSDLQNHVEHAHQTCGNSCIRWFTTLVASAICGPVGIALYTLARPTIWPWETATGTVCLIVSYQCVKKYRAITKMEKFFNTLHAHDE